MPIDDAQDEALRVSHEAIYSWVYAQPVGALARELIALRTRAYPPGAAQRHHPRAPDQRAALDRGAPR